MYIPFLKLIKFTFHYVSIKSYSVFPVTDTSMYLHSTMYLLNRPIVSGASRAQRNLHSTMYLLNQPHQ